MKKLTYYIYATNVCILNLRYVISLNHECKITGIIGSFQIIQPNLLQLVATK